METVAQGFTAVNTGVYGHGMDARLTKADWLDHGLRTLAASGANALKVAPMAEALKVSRGSFYWHFKDIADYRSDLLRYWRERTTDQVIEELEAQKSASGRLNYLMKRAVNSDHRLDRAVRNWAAEDPAVAAVVATVDAGRVAYVARMLKAVGVREPQASSRAAFLYWAYLGQAAVMEPRHASMAQVRLDEICELFKA